MPEITNQWKGKKGNRISWMFGCAWPTNLTHDRASHQRCEWSGTRTDQSHHGQPWPERRTLSHTQNTHAKRKSIYSVTAIYLLYIISVSCSSLPYSGALPLSLSNKHGGILLWQIRTDTVSHGQWTILVQRAARVYETLVTLLACVKPERLISKSDRISLRVNRV